MNWEELYPIVKEQAYWAVLRYEEPQRRKDKIQELICQSYEKYLRDNAAGKEIKKQSYKYFVTSRAKSVDTRSFCKKGYGGTSTIDVLGYYRRRPDSPTPVIELDEWMTANVKSRNSVEDLMLFNIDYKDWLRQLDRNEKVILNYLIEGFKIQHIAEILETTAGKVRSVVKRLKELFIKYFHRTPHYACN